MKATDLIEKAGDVVGGDRAVTHGDKHKNFASIAALWNAYLATRRDPASEISSGDVGWMMTLLKLARAQGGALNADDYVDAIGYIACAGEIILAKPS